MLKNIFLEIPDGDFLGVIGSSGAGKTTLSYAINGIIPHHYKGQYFGKVLVNDKDVFDTDACQLALEIGSVFQDIDSQMTCSTVEDEILFGLENFGFEKEEIAKQRKELIKQAEKDLLADYEEELKACTFSQGKVLIKMIDRETGRTSYVLVNELRGKLRASFYQVFARIFGFNLKTHYDPQHDKKDNDRSHVRNYTK